MRASRATGHKERMPSGFRARVSKGRAGTGSAAWGMAIQWAPWHHERGDKPAQPRPVWSLSCKKSPATPTVSPTLPSPASSNSNRQFGPASRLALSPPAVRPTIFRPSCLPRALSLRNAETTSLPLSCCPGLSCCCVAIPCGLFQDRKDVPERKAQWQRPPRGLITAVDGDGTSRPSHLWEICSTATSSSTTTSSTSPRSWSGSNRGTPLRPTGAPRSSALALLMGARPGTRCS